MHPADKHSFPKENFIFLAGGGEMGNAIRAKNWDDGPLGDPSAWPQSLKTMVSVMLDNPFGMYIAWGKEYIQLYNDAYRPILGATKHPQALGISTRDTFSEIWNIIGSMFDDVMNGKAVGFPDFMLPLNRNGFVEECYFDFSYSPIRKEDGIVGGVLVTVIETTEKKRAQAALKEQQDQLEFAIEASDLATWDIDPVNNRFTGNDRLKEWHGLLPGDVFNLETGFDIVIEKDRQALLKAINESLDYSSGGIFDHEYTIINPATKQERIVRAKGKTSFGNDKIAYRLNGILEDVTQKVNSKRKIEESERNLRSIIMHAPVAMCVFKGPLHVVEIANELMLDLWGKTADQVIGKPIFEGLPEAKGQGLEPIVNNVFISGETFKAHERPVNLPRNGLIETTYINFVYEPLRNDFGSIIGILAVATDVSMQVIERQKIEENEERLNIIINASELGTWELNLIDKSVKYSLRYLEIFGYSNWIELTHQQILQHLYPEDLPVREAAFKKAIDTGLLHYESRLVWTDGSIHWFEGKGKVFYNDDRQPSHLIGTIRDITEEKYYQQEILNREKKFRLLADSMPQLVWTGAADGNLNYFNQSVYDYAGVSVEQIEKDGWLQIVHPDDREENIRRWTASVNSGKNFLLEHRFRRADGQFRWQLSRAIPQKDADGNIQMWVGTSTDIHEIKEQDQQKDLFISMASHELKTPLTSIKGYIQLLNTMYAGTKDNTLKNALSTIDKKILNLVDVISSMLDLSKIKAGMLSLKNELFELEEFVQEIVTEAGHIHSGYNIIFDSAGKKMIWADKNRVAQVLVNFLSNAVKYSPISGMIKVKTDIGKEQVSVFVEDRGIGISSENQKKIFDRFFRVEGNQEHAFPGMGIGLFIAADIIQKHSGQIGVTSEIGNGSCFYFSLPLTGTSE